MKRAVLTKLAFALAALVLALGMLACSDSDDGGTGSDAGDDRGRGDLGGSDVGSDIPGLDQGLQDLGGGAANYAQCAAQCAGDADCLSIPGVEGAAYCSPRCSAQTTCPSGTAGDAQCVLTDTDDNFTNCALLCDEANIGTGTGCPTGMTCQATGQGTGICMWPAAQAEGAYDQCGEGVGNCAAEFDCLQAVGLAETFFCSPQCAGTGSACPSPEGASGLCALGEQGAAEPSNCALVCDEADAGTGTGCPAGMTCTATGQGAGLCLW